MASIEDISTAVLAVRQEPEWAIAVGLVKGLLTRSGTAHLTGKNCTVSKVTYDKSTQNFWVTDDRTPGVDNVAMTQVADTSLAVWLASSMEFAGFDTLVEAKHMLAFELTYGYTTPGA